MVLKATELLFMAELLFQKEPYSFYESNRRAPLWEQQQGLAPTLRAGQAPRPSLLPRRPGSALPRAHGRAPAAASSFPAAEAGAHSLWPGVPTETDRLSTARLALPHVLQPRALSGSATAPDQPAAALQSSTSSLTSVHSVQAEEETAKHAHFYYKHLIRILKPDSSPPQALTRRIIKLIILEKLRSPPFSNI